MKKLKTLFRSKNEMVAYEGLVLVWPCVEKISSHLASLVPGEQRDLLLPVVKEAIAAYHQPYPCYMTDWERLAVYLIMTINFITKIHAGKMTFYEIAKTCSLPRKMTPAFIEDTAKKLSLELEHA